MFEDHDAYVEARDANVAHVGQSDLRFYLRIDPSHVIRPVERQRGTLDDRNVSHQYTSRVEDALEPVVASANLRVLAEPWGGVKTGGPIPDQQYAVQLIGFAVTAATTIVLLTDFADVLHRVIAKTKELTKNDVGISNGDAVILAAEAIFGQTGERDLAFAFETPMSKYLPDVEEWEGTFDGWLVGFRSRDRLYTAHVDWFGNVTLSGTDISTSWRSTP